MDLFIKTCILNSQHIKLFVQPRTSLCLRVCFSYLGVSALRGGPGFSFILRNWGFELNAVTANLTSVLMAPWACQLRWAIYTKNGIFSYISLFVHTPWKNITSPHFPESLGSQSHSLSCEFLCKTESIVFTGLIMFLFSVMTRFLTWPSQILPKHQKIGYQWRAVIKGCNSSAISSF